MPILPQQFCFQEEVGFIFLTILLMKKKFTVKIYYDKELFGHLIIQFVDQMTQEIKQNKKLNDSGWGNTAVFVNETDCLSAYFESCVFLTVNICQLIKKKMSAIECPFEEFKEKVKIEHHIILKEKNEGKFIITIQCLGKK